MQMTPDLVAHLFNVYGCRNPQLTMGTETNVIFAERDTIEYLFQTPSLLPWVRENIEELKGRTYMGSITSDEHMLSVIAIRWDDVVYFLVK